MTLQGLTKELLEVRNIYDTFQAMASALDAMPFQDQTEAVDQLRPMSIELWRLEQKKVFGITDEEHSELVTKLKASATLWKSLDKSSKIAGTIADLQAKVGALSDSDPTLEEISAVQAQLKQLKDTHRDLSSGAKEAIETLDGCLNALQTIAEAMQGPSSPAPQPSSMPSSSPQRFIPDLIPPADVPSPLPRTPSPRESLRRPVRPLTERTAIIAERVLQPATTQMSKEAAQIITLQEEGRALINEVNNPDIEEGFKKILAFYAKVLSFEFPSQFIDDLITDAEDMLERVILRQERRENPKEPPTVSAPALVIKSVEMRARVAELKAFKLVADGPPGLLPPDSPEREAIDYSNPLAMIYQHLLPRHSEPIQTELITIPEEEDTAQFEALQSFSMLTGMLFADSREASLKDLEKKKLMVSFKISDPRPQLISDRVLFHLHLIHKNEYSEEDWEMAISRTRMEVSLETLEDMINFGISGPRAMGPLLHTLEQGKIAPLLFSKFYDLHAGARNVDTSLADPQNPKYLGNFGHKGFMEVGAGIDPSLKLAAIEQVRQEMKKAWEINKEKF